MTSAPQSASCRTAVGPARTRVRSITLNRAGGQSSCARPFRQERASSHETIPPVEAAAGLHLHDLRQFVKSSPDGFSPIRTVLSFSERYSGTGKLSGAGTSGTPARPSRISTHGTGKVTAWPVRHRTGRIGFGDIRRQASQMRADTHQHRTLRLDRTVPVLRIGRLLHHFESGSARTSTPGSVPAAFSPSLGVRLTISMAIATPRTKTCCPDPDLTEISMSIGAPAAITLAAGFIKSISGQAIAPAPITAPESVISEIRSRRVGSGPEEGACDDMISILADTAAQANRRCDEDFVSWPADFPVCASHGMAQSGAWHDPSPSPRT